MIRIGGNDEKVIVDAGTNDVTLTVGGGPFATTFVELSLTEAMNLATRLIEAYTVIKGGSVDEARGS